MEKQLSRSSPEERREAWPSWLMGNVRRVKIPSAVKTLSLRQSPGLLFVAGRFWKKKKKLAQPGWAERWCWWRKAAICWSTGGWKGKREEEEEEGSVFTWETYLPNVMQTQINHASLEQHSIRSTTTAGVTHTLTRRKTPGRVWETLTHATGWGWRQAWGAEWLRQADITNRAQRMAGVSRSRADWWR